MTALPLRTKSTRLRFCSAVIGRLPFVNISRPSNCARYDGVRNEKSILATSSGEGRPTASRPSDRMVTSKPPIFASSGRAFSATVMLACLVRAACVSTRTFFRACAWPDIGVTNAKTSANAANKMRILRSMAPIVAPLSMPGTPLRCRRELPPVPPAAVSIREAPRAASPAWRRRHCRRFGCRSANRSTRRRELVRQALVEHLDGLAVVPGDRRAR